VLAGQLGQGPREALMQRLFFSVGANFDGVSLSAAILDLLVNWMLVVSMIAIQIIVD
jgi:hypothetical protein